MRDSFSSHARYYVASGVILENEINGVGCPHAPALMLPVQRPQDIFDLLAELTGESREEIEKEITLILLSARRYSPRRASCRPLRQLIVQTFRSNYPVKCK